MNVDIPDPNKKSEIERYKESGVVNKVKFLVPPKACEICQSFADKVFDLDSAPPLPPQGCTCNGKYVSTNSPVAVSWKELGDMHDFDFRGVEKAGPTFEEIAKKYNMSPAQVARYTKNKDLS